MDKKCLQLVSDIHHKIFERTFTEIDICSLLILIRECTPQNTDYAKTEWDFGYLHEICDFIAHRSKNKGFIFENAKLVYKHGSSTGEVHDIDTHRKILCGMFEDTVIEELNRVFDTIGLARVPKNIECEIISCIISLLQLTSFETKDGKANGYIYTIISPDGVHMLNYVNGTGIHLVHLSVEDAQYQNLVTEEITLSEDIFKLERKGTKLTIILPNG